jgi:hypothetical protein
VVSLKRFYSATFVTPLRASNGDWVNSSRSVTEDKREI